MFKETVKILAVCAAMAFAACAEAGEMRKKALVVMLDGCRADAVENAAAPNLRALMDGRWQQGYKCAWSLTGNTILDAPTMSAPNHLAIATGVTGANPVK